MAGSEFSLENENFPAHASSLLPTGELMIKLSSYKATGRDHSVTGEQRNGCYFLLLLDRFLRQILETG